MNRYLSVSFGRLNSLISSLAPEKLPIEKSTPSASIRKYHPEKATFALRSGLSATLRCSLALKVVQQVTDNPNFHTNRCQARRQLTIVYLFIAASSELSEPH